jgi:hypothetical protein
MGVRQHGGDFLSIDGSLTIRQDPYPAVKVSGSVRLPRDPYTAKPRYAPPVPMMLCTSALHKGRRLLPAVEFDQIDTCRACARLKCAPPTEETPTVPRLKRWSRLNTYLFRQHN